MTAWPALAGAVGTACGIPSPVEPLRPIDWPAFRTLAERHRVEALVHRSGWAQAHGAPEEICRELARAGKRTALQTLRHLDAQREVVGALEAAGLPVVVLKGPVVAHEAYGDVAVRHARDVDVLIAPADVAAAAVALERHGLTWSGLEVRDRAVLPDGGRAHLAHAERLPLLHQTTFDWHGVRVEVHWRLTENAHLMPFDERWLRDPRRVAVAGSPTPVLPFDVAWQYLFVHGARHHWMRLKWLADVAALALRRPELVTRDALERIDGTGIERCVASGLLVAERVLGRFLGVDARTWALATPASALLTRTALASLARDDVGAQGVPAAALPRVLAGRFLLRGDSRYRMAEARRALLEAGRAHTVPDPGMRLLLTGPARWAARRLPPSRSSAYGTFDS